MSAERRILVTGATGLVGAQLLEQLARHPHLEVVGTSLRGAAERGIVAWDMAEEPPAALRRQWDVIINTAADVRWTMEAEVALRANVATLEGLTQLVGPATHVVHVSTAYVTGHHGSVESNDLADYRNTYEWSKARGERIVRERFEHLTIVRPSLIIGRRGDGFATRFAGMYVVLRGIASSTIPCLPAATGAFCDVVPVDDVAGVLEALALREEPGRGEIRTVAGGPAASSVDEVVPLMVDTLNAWRAERGLDPFGQPRLLSPESWDRFFLPFARDHLSPRQLRALDLLRTYEPYLMLVDPIPATDIARDVLPTVAASTRAWADTLPRLASMPLRPWKSTTSNEASLV